VDSAIAGSIRRLRARDERERTGRFVLEGVAPFLHACRASVALDRIVWNRLLLRNPEARAFVRSRKREGVPTLHVAPDAFRDLSETARASGVLAVARQRWTALERLDTVRGTVRVAVERIRSAGNLGTILRTAEALGAEGVLFVGGASDPFEPAVIRASMGTVCDLELTRTSRYAFTSWSRARGVRIVGTSPRGERDARDLVSTGPIVVLLGDERVGLSASAMASCTECVRIPIVGRCDSLNVGVAAGIVLHQLLVRRAPRAASGQPRS
jgi:TrmH family RNA methyltransferase